MPKCHAKSPIWVQVHIATSVMHKCPKGALVQRCMTSASTSPSREDCRILRRERETSNTLRLSVETYVFTMSLITCPLAVTFGEHTGASRKVRNKNKNCSKNVEQMKLTRKKEGVPDSNVNAITSARNKVTTAKNQCQFPVSHTFHSEPFMPFNLSENLCRSLHCHEPQAYRKLVLGRQEEGGLPIPNYPPSAPVITGYRKEEILRAGDRRTLSCRSRGGNPQPSVSWYRSGELVDDTAARDATGTVNTLDLVVTSEEDGAAYECRVSNEVMEAPLTANVTLTVYYSPSSVSLTGPNEIEEGKHMTFACETSESNPPSSLLWTVQGKVLNNVKERVSRVSSGGWVTSSELTQYVVKAHRETEVSVECRAVNPAIDRVVKKKLVIGITQPPGPPVLEGDLSTEVIAGSTLDLKCSSMGGHPPPTVRIYKEDKEIFTSILRKENVTQARGKIEVSPVDNGSKVTCVVTSSASRAPLLTSATLTVLFAPWEVAGSAIPDIVEEGQVVTLSCESSSSHPPANITWKSGETILQAESVHFTQGAFGGTNTRSEIQVRPTAEDNGRAFTCEADNGLGSILKTDVSLNVLHGPRWVVEPAPQLDVYEGADLVIIASAASNPGPPKYWWWRGEETLLGSESKLRLGRITRQFTGNYTVTAYSQKGAINSTFFLNVQCE
ncbi:nephrin-like [Penaeus chinensis]|uniref:nephrin-like n=1 Tax=Penaeus chinensis TaxID=139456 RepID=UPI001FB7B39E|nr:nephrin-like [Penaeus chinensis]